jgi:Nucleotide modification associated domain 2
MRLFSYVVARDYGFAPNPFYGFCTLATCKPKIRKAAAVGDWVIGTGSKRRGMEGHLVFAMHVAEILTFDDYWLDSRFANKKPNLAVSKKQAFGDNIYHRDSDAVIWKQENSHHSLENGSPNWSNIKNDTKTTLNVLVGSEYTYWGGTGPEILHDFRNFKGHDICAIRGHKNHFPDEMVEAFLKWFTSLDKQGYIGEPLDWARTP